MTSRVFVTCQPIRIDDGQIVNTVDLSHAGKLGAITLILKERYTLSLPNGSFISQITKMLEGFCDDDYLLPLGDPVTMCIIAGIAGKINGGRIRYLKWDRRKQEYEVVQATI